MSCRMLARIPDLIADFVANQADPGVSGVGLRLVPAKCGGLFVSDPKQHCNCLGWTVDGKNGVHTAHAKSYGEGLRPIEMTESLELSPNCSDPR